MLGLSHVILHVALCNAVARATPETTVAMRVAMAYRTGPAALDKVFRFARGDDPQVTVEFDVPRGTYRLELDVPKYGCSASDFINVLAERDRTIAETLVAGSPTAPKPVVLLEGTAPPSFQYVRPTFVLFDSTLQCNQPVGTPLASHIVVENDRDAYYVWLHFDPALDARDSVVALRLRTTTGLHHYVRVRMPFPPAWGGWPNNVQFNVTEEQLDGLATEKADTLLCPRLWESSVPG